MILIVNLVSRLVFVVPVAVVNVKEWDAPEIIEKLLGKDRRG
jgi:hypothetical protein